MRTSTQISWHMTLRCSTLMRSTRQVDPTYWLSCATASNHVRPWQVEVAHLRQQTAARQAVSPAQRKAAEAFGQLASLHGCHRAMSRTCRASTAA